ncbi:hypothetical protein BY996DRAFT_1977429 [Phakopsora pachyrhizi]|nr:hypothetical protein BY996DRAFT_1977429 [Phakopsora pachyrhizi]
MFFFSFKKENSNTVDPKWLAKHELSESYLDQVVDFIDKNTSGVLIGGKHVGSDLYTRFNSYRPYSNSSNGKVASRASLKPLTGDGIYKINQYNSSDFNSRNNILKR